MPEARISQHTLSHIASYIKIIAHAYRLTRPWRRVCQQWLSLETPFLVEPRWYCQHGVAHNGTKERARTTIGGPFPCVLRLSLHEMSIPLRLGAEITTFCLRLLWRPVLCFNCFTRCLDAFQSANSRIYSIGLPGDIKRPPLAIQTLKSIPQRRCETRPVIPRMPSGR